MKGIKFEGATFDLIKPNNMTDEQCNSLPATRGVDNNGFEYILTAFQPSEEDIKAFNEGRPLYLKVIGTSFAPVSLYTLNENGEGNFED